MTKTNFDRIVEGMNEAIAFARGDDAPDARVHIPADIDIKAIRKKVGGLTQAAFAERYGFSLGAVRDWEQGRQVPDPSTRAYLKVVSFTPEIVGDVLKAGRPTVEDAAQLEAKIKALSKEGQHAMRTIQKGGYSIETMTIVVDREAEREARDRKRKPA